MTLSDSTFFITHESFSVSKWSIKTHEYHNQDPNHWMMNAVKIITITTIMRYMPIKRYSVTRFMLSLSTD